MRFWAYDHIGKAGPYIKALQKHRHQRVEDINHADLVLLDIEHAERKPYLDHAVQHGIPVAVYLHGGYPLARGDEPSFFQPSRHVRLHLVPAPGHIACYKAQDLPPRRYLVTGFPWTEQQPFKPSREVKTVVFAPAHPSANGYMAEPWREGNHRAQERILELFPEAKVLVSVYGTLDQNGLEPADNWEFIPSRQELGVGLIDQGDLIVAIETFACQAIAHGKPTVVFNQRMMDWHGNRPWGADAIEPIMRYPYDLDDTLSVRQALRQEVAIWRWQFVGTEFHPGLVARACERLLRTRTAA